MNKKALHGSIHGRFQPFHNAHLAYALAALHRVERLYVGLTRVLTEEEIGQEFAPHRFRTGENPLSYYQRVEIVLQALLKAGVPRERFHIGPFPIEVPDRLPDFWPKSAPCFTTIVDRWNKRKIEILEVAGYNVTVLDLDLSGKAVASGTDIRTRFRSGDKTWQNFVPEGVVNCITERDWTL